MVAFYDNPIGHRRAGKERESVLGAIESVLEKLQNKFKSVFFSRKLIFFMSKIILSLKQ